MADGEENVQDGLHSRVNNTKGNYATVERDKMQTSNIILNIVNSLAQGLSYQ